MVFDDTRRHGRAGALRHGVLRHRKLRQVHALPHRLDARRRDDRQDHRRRATSTQNIALLDDLCDTMKFGSLCALGGFTPYPVMSALDHFPEDFGARPRAEPRRNRRPPCRSSRRSITARRRRRPTKTVDADHRRPEVTVPEGTSIMRAAMEAGTQIPKLCATDMLEGLRLLPAVPGRDRGPRRHARLLHHAGRAGHGGAHPDRRGSKQLRRGVMELYISDHPLDCLTCAANGDCELQDMAGAVGLREVRYGYDGENHLKPRRRTSPTPISPTIPSKCIVCSRCVRACEEVQGTFALTIAGRGFDIRGLAGHGRSRSCDSECVSCGACVQACPTATLIEKIGHRDRPAGAFAWSPPAPIAASAARFKAEMRGDEVVRMVPVQGRQGQRRPFLRQGPLRLGLCHPQGPHPQADDPRQDHRSLARSVAGTRRSATRRREFKRIQAQIRPRARSAASPPRAAPTRRPSWCRSWSAPAFGNNNVDTCARVCHSPTGYGLKHDLRHLGRHAGFRLGRAGRRRSW